MLYFIFAVGFLLAGCGGFMCYISYMFTGLFLIILGIAAMISAFII